MKIKSWHIVLLAVLSYSLSLLFWILDWYSARHYIAWNLLFELEQGEDIFYMCAILISALLLVNVKTRKVGAIFAILSGLTTNLLVTVPLLYFGSLQKSVIDDLPYFISASGFILSSILLLYAGLFFFLKENKTAKNDATLK